MATHSSILAWNIPWTEDLGGLQSIGSTELDTTELIWHAWTVAHQAPLSMRFSRQEYWSGLPFPPPGDLPNPEIKPVYPTVAGRFFITEPPEKHSCNCSWYYTFLLSLHITYSLCLWSSLVVQVSSHGEVTQIFISEVFGPLALDYY